MTEELKKAFEANENYIFSRFNIEMAVPNARNDERIFDILNMVKDYLNTIKDMMIQKKEILDGFVKFAKDNHLRYEVDEWGNKIN